MLIQVNQEHIDKGVVGSVSECPVALAVKEHSGCDRVVANPSYIMVANKGVREGVRGKFIKSTVKTPSVVASFIDNFDRYYKVEPFEFELEDI